MRKKFSTINIIYILLFLNIIICNCYPAVIFILDQITVDFYLVINISFCMFFCSACNCFKFFFLIFYQLMLYSSFFTHGFAFLIVMLLFMELCLSFLFFNFYFSFLLSFLSSSVINFSLRITSLSI